MAKFYVLAGAVANGHVLWLVIVGGTCVLPLAYTYYFRVIQAMYFKEGDIQEMEVSLLFKALLCHYGRHCGAAGVFSPIGCWTSLTTSFNVIDNHLTGSGDAPLSHTQ